MSNEIDSLSKNALYYSDSDCFTDAPLHLVHAYLHPNYKIDMHSHQFYEINIIVSGNGEHKIGESAFPANVGDVFVLPPEVAHGYESDGTMDICHILLQSSFILRYREELSALPGFSLLFDIEPHLRRKSGHSYNLHLSASDLGYVNSDIQEIIRAEYERQYALEDVLTLSFIGKLGLLLKRSLEQRDILTHRGVLPYVMGYIQKHLEKKLTLDLLSSKAHTSKATLNRLFREALNTAPMQYVTACRLSKARQLLITGAYTKAEIAQACGFYDVAHMNKYIKG